MSHCRPLAHARRVVGVIKIARDDKDGKREGVARGEFCQPIEGAEKRWIAVAGRKP
jgi:hypothetical protein